MSRYCVNDMIEDLSVYGDLPHFEFLSILYNKEYSYRI